MGDLQAKDIHAFLDSQSNKPTLRFITCGSVDDGKSTLIGRLLYESKAIFDDQLVGLEKDSRQYGTQGEQIDLALLVDGLQAEREQGITIDVAYRFFATDKRRYIVADTPGHEQYTRNMATGASTAHVAVILIDARKGVLTQTRRHSRIVAMMGIRHVVLAINKMDLMDFRQEVFDTIETDYRRFAQGLGFETLHAIPVSGLGGDNVLQHSAHTAWYTGPSLMDYLDSLDAWPSPARQAFRMPVQWVNRPHLDFRGFCGTVVEGVVRPGDAVRVLPSGVQTQIKEVWCGFQAVTQAQKGQAITVTLSDEVDASRGDVLVSREHPPEMADQFEAKLLWMTETEMTPGRQYILKLATKEVSATMTSIKYREDVNTGAHLAAKSLGLNELGCVNLATSAPLVFESYATNRALGSFILIDKLTFETVGAGMLEYALRRASNIHWQALDIDQQARAQQKHQKAQCIWMTGLSGSGKSTIANLLEKRLYALGRHTYVIDGDNVRHGLNRDLGFTVADRVENLRRVAEVARLMVDAGLVVIVSMISPFRSERDWARSLFEPGEFVEVFVDTPLSECELRDAKGLYAKARRGDLKNFTGIDSPYEEPQSPEVHIQTQLSSQAESVESILARLEG